jgi:hypothetical protein
MCFQPSRVLHSHMYHCLTISNKHTGFFTFKKLLMAMGIGTQNIVKMEMQFKWEHMAFLELHTRKHAIAQFTHVMQRKVSIPTTKLVHTGPYVSWLLCSTAQGCHCCMYCQSDCLQHIEPLLPTLTQVQQFNMRALKYTPGRTHILFIPTHFSTPPPQCIF